MARNAARPLSPHLTIWKWGPHMAVSILHRATGTALATAGAMLFTWWLAAAASGEESYASFIDLMTPDTGAGLAGLNLLPFVVLFGLSWAFFQHMCSGLRHFLLDTGAGYDLATNRRWARMVFVGGAVLTVLFWAIIWSRG